MTAHTCLQAQTGTLAAATADSVTFPNRVVPTIINLDGTQIIFARFDGTTAVVDADENYAIPPNYAWTAPVSTTVVSLISTAGGKYQVHSLS